LALPWYARTWYLTGNPVYPLDLGGMFPVNPVYAGLLEAYTQMFGLEHLSEVFQLSTASKLVLGAPLAILLGVPALFIAWREVGPAVAAVLITAMLWLFSVSYTAGGLDYSMRVLTPAWVGLAVCAGAIAPSLLRLLNIRRLLRAASLLFLSLAGTYAVAHSFAHPGEAWDLPNAALITNADPLEIRKPKLQLCEGLQASDYPACGVLTDDSYLATALNRKSRFRPVMVWSPEVAFVFDTEAAPIEIRSRLRKNNILLASLMPGTANASFLASFPFYRNDGPNWSPAMAVEGAEGTTILFFFPRVDAK
jgi:hypothetical protein